MRSDAKLGLALGMLVIGFAVAFCFPRERRVVTASEEHFDRGTIDEATVKFVPIRSLRPEELTVDPRLLATDVDARDVNPTSEDEEVRPLEPTPAPSSRLGLRDLIAVDVTPGDEAEVLPTLAPPQDSEESPATAKEIYVVQAGDTLSGIAMKTLGSYSRYLDIYEANKTQLRSPDDLRLGMQLTIPGLNPKGLDREVVRQKDVNIAEGSHDGNDDLMHKADDAEKRFQRPDSPPFITDRRTSIPLQQIPASQLTAHVVEEGDTLERIAVRYFGTVRAVDQLRKLNPELTSHPRLLRPGAEVKLVP